jgi:nucleolar complex protein 3
LRVPLPNAEKEMGSESSDEEGLDEEDLELLMASAGDLDFLDRLPKKEMDKSVSQSRGKVAIPRHASGEDPRRQHKGDIDIKEDTDGEVDDSESEEDWERQPRKRAEPKKEKPKSRSALPVKSLDGTMLKLKEDIEPDDLQIESNAFEGVTVLDDGRMSKEEEKKRIAAIKQQKDEELRAIKKREKEEREALKQKLEISQTIREEKDKDKKYKEEALLCLKECATISERLEKAKFVIAKSSQSLLSSPEHHLRKQMPILLELVGDYDPNVSRLSMLSILAVMRDIIPAYKIRPQHEREKDDVVQSKEVQELWAFENLLLKSYQAYLKILLKAFKNQKEGSNSALALSRVSATCLSLLVIAAPHFNFAGDILQVVVPGIANKDRDIKNCCANAIKTLVREALLSADSGQCAVEATQLLADFVKRRKCVGLPPDVVSCLMDFTFPDISSAEDFDVAKKSKKKKKKKKKGGKDEVSKAFKEAQAVIDKDTRRYQQSAVLEAMFELYFRVLKTTEGSLKGMQASSQHTGWSPNRFAKRFPLLAPTLQGLAKFAHLISVDYFHDIVSTIESILESPCVPHDIRCRCLLTASDISRGQGESLNVDRAALFKALYKVMYSVTESSMEEDDQKLPAKLTPETMHSFYPPSAMIPMRDVEDSPQYLLTRVVEEMLLDSQKTLDIHRQAAFTKRAATVALQATDSGLALAMLYVIYRMLKRYPKLRSMIEDDEGAGPSTNYFSAIVSKNQGQKTSVEYANEDPSIHSGALYTPLWELSVLSANHTNPGVRKAAAFVSLMSVTAANAAATGSTGDGVAALSSLFPTNQASNLSPSAVCMFNTTQNGKFRPLVTSESTLRRRERKSYPKSPDNAPKSGTTNGGWVGVLDAKSPYIQKYTIE